MYAFQRYKNGTQLLQLIAVKIKRAETEKERKKQWKRCELNSEHVHKTNQEMKRTITKHQHNEILVVFKKYVHGRAAKYISSVRSAKFSFILLIFLVYFFGKILSIRLHVLFSIQFHFRCIIGFFCSFAFRWLAFSRCFVRKYYFSSTHKLFAGFFVFLSLSLIILFIKCLRSHF